MDIAVVIIDLPAAQQQLSGARHDGGPAIART
jgi:hypothetical protein